ncbi:MAG: hypothetical protein HXY19_02440 [Thermoanaerobaculaceae bacterium]|nr:hypothetical protein [Thermoanaerobaculaceae bacterium]
MGRRIVFLALVPLLGCALQDPTTPVPQPDTLILGRLVAVREVPQEPGVWEVEIRAGLPETLVAVMRREGRPVPQLEKDLAVKVRVTRDTVCIVEGVPTELAAFRVGQELAVVPKPGTCAMVGSKLLLAEAGEFYHFASYEVHHLPRALQTLPPSVTSRTDPARINSAGQEQTPLPLADGRVVYFAAGLLPPVQEGGEPLGAVRPGMRQAGGALARWAVGGVRPYRVVWQEGRWSSPEPVVFPGLAEDASARITWVNESETECLVEVVTPGAPTFLAEARREKAGAPWGKLVRSPLATGAQTGGGQRFGREGKSLVWTVMTANGSDLWLAVGGATGQPLEPRINTLGSEWAPRVGPGNTLYFCREQRQLLFAGGIVQDVRLAGTQRRPLLEATPARGGTLLFFRVPRYAPGQVEWDLAVATRVGEGWGPPVPLDEWRPAA